MNIIELAKEAGGIQAMDCLWRFTREELERFAILVRAEALEEAFLVCQQVSLRYLDHYGPDECAAAIKRLK